MPCICGSGDGHCSAAAPPCPGLQPSGAEPVSTRPIPLGTGSHPEGPPRGQLGACEHEDSLIVPCCREEQEVQHLNAQ